MWSYITSREWCILLTETLRGKDLNRILTNLASRKFEAYGRILDVGGGGGKSSYWRFMKQTRWHRLTTLDIDPKSNPTVVHNLEEVPLPFTAEYFDTIMLFNVLEHLNARTEILKELHRTLHVGGVIVGIIPFLVNVHPDPNDYVRLTRQGLEELLSSAGFSSVRVQYVGRGPLVASYYQSEFLWPRALKLLILPIVLTLDKIILTLRPSFGEKFPLSYAFSAKK